MPAPSEPEIDQYHAGSAGAGAAPLERAGDPDRGIDLELAAEYGFTPQQAAAMSMYL